MERGAAVLARQGNGAGAFLRGHPCRSLPREQVFISTSDSDGSRRSGL
jgi:hypothetical protein